LAAPLFFLVYGLSTWFGPTLLSYQNINRILSLLEIALASVSLYLFPQQLINSSFLLYLVGIIASVLYGDYLASILLSIAVNLCYTATIFPHLNSDNHQHFYLLLINFNLVTVLISIIGWKIKKMLETIGMEKDASKKQLFRLQALSRIVKEITSELELDKLLNLIVLKTTELMKANAGGIIILENENTYRLKAAKGIPKNLIGKEIQPVKGLLGHLLNKREISFSKINTALMETVSPLDKQYEFLITSPIFSKGEFIGLSFLLTNSQTNHLSKDDKLILETMSEYAAIGMVNANLFKTTASLGVNDYLTGVGNLRFFYQQLEHCLAVANRYQQPCSLMMVDSDCFREIKHTYGNAEGFKHIKYLAEILKISIRNSDLISRYDRDTFMIILPQTTLEEAITLGERIRSQVLNHPGSIKGKPINTTVSIGIASYPEQAKNIKMLVNIVESALHQAAKLGGNQLVTATTLNVPVE
jgi:diguanylate cyclase (GGDEF)-like protein